MHLEDVLLGFSMDGKYAFVAEQVVCHGIEDTAEPFIHLQCMRHLVELIACCSDSAMQGLS